MHVGDTIFIFCLALIIFGPKKLPEIGRQIGKLMVEFRRASNEFKMQIEEELRASEEAERQKEISAATTMLPTPAPAAPSLLESSTTANTAATPVIAPPSTGLPVNHTFATTGGSSEPGGNEAVLTPFASANAEEAAYPESANGFNPGLNTASNGVIAETSVASPTTFPPETVEADNILAAHAEPEQAQAPVHHG